MKNKGENKLMSLFESAAALKAYLLSFGALTPLVYFALQLLQVIVAPIPGGTIGVIGGALFGLPMGFALSASATFIGSCAVFLLTKKFGRPFVERFSNNEWIAKFEAISPEKIDLVLFLVFLFPAFPDDILCFAAGLTKMPFRRFALLVIVGRFPGIFLNTLVGAGLFAENPTVTIAILVGYALVMITLYLLRDKVTKLMN